MLDLEIPVNDTRLARCKHPRLRQALMFEPLKPRARVAPTAPKQTFTPQLRSQARTSGTLSSFKGAFAVAYVRVMEFLFDGFHFVTEPI